MKKGRPGRFSEHAGPERFGYLIKSLHERTGQRVVVLVDEYDKPILGALEQPQVARRPWLSARSVRGGQGERRARALHVSDRSEQVHQGERLLRPEQPHRPHPEPALLGDLQLHGA